MLHLAHLFFGVTALVKYDGVVRFAFNLQDTDQTLGGATERVIDQSVFAWIIDFKFHHGCPSRSHGHGLDAFQRLAAQTTEIVNLTLTHIFLEQLKSSYSS